MIPKIEIKLIRREGDPFWKNLELMGSNDGTPNNPKFSKLW